LIKIVIKYLDFRRKEIFFSFSFWLLSLQSVVVVAVVAVVAVYVVADAVQLSHKSSLI